MEYDKAGLSGWQNLRLDKIEDSDVKKGQFEVLLATYYSTSHRWER